MHLNKTFLTSLLILSFSAFAGDEATIKGSISVPKSKTTLTSLAKISLDEATKIALGKIPGKVTSTMLENEDGYLVYSVNIVGNDKKNHEVIVDAGNGKFLGMNLEDGKPKDMGDGDGEENDD